MTRMTGQYYAVMCNLTNIHTRARAYCWKKFPRNLQTTNRHNIREAGVIFDSHPRRKNKPLLLDIVIANPCNSSNLENAVPYRKTPRRRIRAEEKQVWARFPQTTPSFLSPCRSVSWLAKTYMPFFGARHQADEAQVRDTLQ